MTWSAPMTAVAGATFSAAQFNQYVRDNLLETGPAKITAAGQILVGTAANTLAARTIADASISTQETTSSTSYTDLGTVGPAATAVTGTQALVLLYTSAGNSSTGFSAMSYAVSGATTISATDVSCIGGAWGTGGGRASGVALVTGLTAGTNTFTAKYRVTAGTGTYLNRRITVVPL